MRDNDVIAWTTDVDILLPQDMYDALNMHGEHADKALLDALFEAGVLYTARHTTSSMHMYVYVRPYTSPRI